MKLIQVGDGAEGTMAGDKGRAYEEDEAVAATGLELATAVEGLNPLKAGTVSTSRVAYL